MRSRTIFFGVCGSMFVLILVYTLFGNLIPSIWGNYADQRVLLCVVLIALVAAALCGAVTQRSLGQLLCEAALFLPLVITFFGAALQVQGTPFFSVEPIFFTFFFLAFSLAGSWLYRTERSSEIAMLFACVSVAACFFYGATTVNVYVFALNDQVARLDKAIPWGFINIRYWSHIATWLLLLFPVSVMRGPLRNNRLWRFGVAFTAAIWWWLLFLSSSRGSTIGLFVGLLFAGAFFGKTALPWLKVSAKYFVFGVIAWVVLSLIIPSLMLGDIELRGITTDSSGRLPLWQEAFAMSMQNFPLGMGSQSWLTHNPITGVYEASKRFGHPHNMYLMWAAEYGWISVAALCLPGVIGLRRLWQVRPAVKAETHPNGVIVISLTAAAVAALTHAGVSAVFMAPGSMLVGVIVLALFWAVIRSDTMPQSVTSLPGNLVRYLGCVLVLVIVAGAGGIWLREVFRYHDSMLKDEAFTEDARIMANYPRFWIHGYYPRAPQLMPPQASE